MFAAELHPSNESPLSFAPIYNSQYWADFAANVGQVQAQLDKIRGSEPEENTELRLSVERSANPPAVPSLPGVSATAASVSAEAARLAAVPAGSTAATPVAPMGAATTSAPAAPWGLVDAWMNAAEWLLMAKEEKPEDEQVRGNFAPPKQEGDIEIECVRTNWYWRRTLVPKQSVSNFKSF